MQVSSSAWAQEASSTPSPKELWDAYPLEPEQAPATVTPSVSVSPGAVGSPDDDGGVPLAVPLGLAALIACGAGLGLAVLRRRTTAAQPPVLVREEPERPKRFQWRDYPQPARPAPPPPPVPGARGPSFQAALEDERAASPSPAAQQEAR
jgi:hypothetical protein